jgi:hypothetical protein
VAEQQRRGGRRRCAQRQRLHCCFLARSVFFFLSR